MLKERLGDQAETDKGKAFNKAKNNFVLINGLLYWQHQMKDKIEDIHQFVVPQPHRITTLNGCH